MPEVSAYFIATGVAWVIAQGTKYLLSVTASGKRDMRAWYQSGNMPSAHTATMVALTTIVGLQEGVESALFAVTTVLTTITMYDSMMSRRAVGEQGLALRKLIEKSPFAKDRLPHHALGHLPQEVAAGALLGVMIGVVVDFLITR